MLQQGGKKAVLATGVKLDKARSYHIASLDEIDYIVTEDSKVEYIRNSWPKGRYQVL